MKTIRQNFTVDKHEVVKVTFELSVLSYVCTEIAVVLSKKVPASVAKCHTSSE